MSKLKALFVDSTHFAILTFADLQRPSIYRHWIKPVAHNTVFGVVNR